MDKKEGPALLETLPQGLVLHEPDGRIFYANPAAARILGISLDQLLGLDSFHPRWHAIHEDGSPFPGDTHPVMQVLSTFREVRGIIMGVFIPDENAYRWIEIDAIPHFEPGTRTITRVMVVFSDISHRRETEAELHETMRRLKRSQQIAMVGDWSWDIATDRFSASEEGLALMGYPPNYQPAYHEVADLIHPDDRAQARDQLQNALKTGQPYRVEFRFFRRDTGELRHLISMATVEVDARHQPVRVFGVNQDITVRKESEMALRHSENRFRELVDLAVDGILLGDHSGEVIGANQAFCSLVGLEVDQVLGRHIRDLPFDSDNLRLYPFRFDLLQQGGVVENQRTLLRPDGSRVQVEMRSKMMPDGTYQSIIRDISERKEAEAERTKLLEQLLQAQKMESVGRLAGGVAHDFNNMLGVILGYTEMGLNKAGADQALTQYLREIRQAAERSSNLTRQLLAYARKQTVAPKILDFNPTVEGMLAMLERLIGEDIELVWIPGQRLWPVMIDPTQVDQILANLCVNARDAIKENGRITIKTENRHMDEATTALYADAKTGDYVCLTVNDNGCGMDAETQSHLFEPFFTTKELGRGTGLGLATIYGVVKQNHGFVVVYSELGQGSSIQIFLPRYRIRTDELKAVDETDEYMGGEGTILLVEDEPAILEMAALMLKDLGYTVLTSNSPNKAMDIARQYQGEIELLVTDVIMPEMNGRELANKLSTLYPGIKRIFMSGYTAEVIAYHGVLEKGVHFIQKPFTVKELAAKVAGVIDGR